MTTRRKLKTRTEWFRLEAAEDDWTSEDPRNLVAWLEQVVLIRRFEETVLDLAVAEHDPVIRTRRHLVGEEKVPALNPGSPNGPFDRTVLGPTEPRLLRCVDRSVRRKACEWGGVGRMQPTGESLSGFALLLCPSAHSESLTFIAWGFHLSGHVSSRCSSHLSTAKCRV